MASFNTKREFAKKDMNFFSEFTASTRTAQQFLLLGAVIALLIIVGLTLALLFEGITYLKVKSDYNNITEELNSDEYKNIDIEAQHLQSDFSKYTNYEYALTDMRKTITETNAAEVATIQYLAECIPSSTKITSYSLTGSTFEISGRTFSYYGATEMVNLLQDQEVFSSIPNIEITRVDPTTEGTQDSFMSNIINMEYYFTITGTITGDYTVSVARISTDTPSIPLSGIETATVENGDTYQIGSQDESIATYTYNGVVYNLTSILVNGVALSEDDVNAAIAAGAVSTQVNTNTEITLYYTNGTTTSETEVEE